MDSQATWYQRMFPWFFREKTPPGEATGEFYYDVWFDGSRGSETWYYTCYTPEGELLHKGYGYSERRAKEAAKRVVTQEKSKRERIARGKDKPTRYTA